MKNKIILWGIILILLILNIIPSISSFEIIRSNKMFENIYGSNMESSDSLDFNVLNNKSIYSLLIDLSIKYPLLFPILEIIGEKLNSININNLNDEIEYWGLLISVGVYLNHPNQDRPSMLIEVENLYDRLLESNNWEPDHIRKITGKNANLENIIDGFKWLIQMEGRGDITLVYITTHGGFLDSDYPPYDEEDGKDEILVPYEGFDDLTKFLWDDEINFLLSLLQSEGICLIVDSCFSGGFNDQLICEYINNVNYEKGWIEGLISELSGNGRVILMSSEEDEVSYGSSFSKYIARGLGGEADYNHDFICSAEEIFEYVQPIIVNFGMQHPTIVDTYNGELALVSLN